MCLHRIKPLGKVPKTTYAWKVLKRHNSGRSYFTPFRTEYVAVGKWLSAVATQYSLVAMDHPRAHYESGWHCFRTREGARKLLRELSGTWGGSRYVIRKVALEEMCAYGTERRGGRHFDVYVARRMKVLPEVHRGK